MKYIKLYEDYKKNQWELLLSNPNKVQEGEKLVDLVGNAYKNTSMGSFVNTVKDVVKSNWAVIDCNDDPGIDACIFFRDPKSNENWIGRKLQGIGHDGEKKSKIYIIDKMVNMLKESGTWIEASEKLEEVLLAKGSTKVSDIEVLKKLFPKSEFKMLDNGQYQRSLENGTFVTESVFGTPKLK
jgi:hypothetical protein